MKYGRATAEAVLAQPMPVCPFYGRGSPSENTGAGMDRVQKIEPDLLSWNQVLRAPFHAEYAHLISLVNDVPTMPQGVRNLVTEGDVRCVILRDLLTA